MPTLNVAAPDLARLIAAFLRPRVEHVACALEPRELRVELRGVDTQAKALGRALPRLDVDLYFAVRLLDARTAEATWRIGPVKGLPALVVAALPIERIAQGIVAGAVVERGLDWIEVQPGKLIGHLERIEWGRLGRGTVRWHELALPAGADVALRARVEIG